MAIRRYDPREFLERVGEGKTITGYKTGQNIFKQGAVAEWVYYLQLGKCKETILTERGKQAVISIIEPCTFFGTSSLDAGLQHHSTVTAMTPCTVTAFTFLALRDALRTPLFADLFMKHLIGHSREIEADKIALLFNSSEHRLAQKLLTLSGWGEGPPRRIGPDVTQEMLASTIGTTRPHVNYFLNKFRRAGFIAYFDDGITVLPQLLNAVLHGRV